VLNIVLVRYDLSTTNDKDTTKEVIYYISSHFYSGMNRRTNDNCSVSFIAGFVGDSGAIVLKKDPQVLETNAVQDDGFVVTLVFQSII
jgi:hypothetical protein